MWQASAPKMNEYISTYVLKDVQIESRFYRSARDALTAPKINENSYIPTSRCTPNLYLKTYILNHKYSNTPFCLGRTYRYLLCVPEDKAGLCTEHSLKHFESNITVDSKHVFQNEDGTTDTRFYARGALTAPTTFLCLKMWQASVPKTNQNISTTIFFMHSKYVFENVQIESRLDRSTRDSLTAPKMSENNHTPTSRCTP